MPTSCKVSSENKLYSWLIPESPWSRLHIDFPGQQYLILVDADSKWPGVFHMNPPTSSETVRKLQEIFSRVGTPEILVSDHGTAFTPAEVSDFCKQNSIQSLRSSPFHPQSNGQAERFVDTFKKALLKLKEEGSTREIIEIFLRSSSATTNPNCPNRKSLQKPWWTGKYGYQLI